MSCPIGALTANAEHEEVPKLIERSTSHSAPMHLGDLVACQAQVSQAGQGSQLVQAVGLKAALSCFEHPQRWEAAFWGCPTA